jgi:hypothetical protein
MENCSDKKDNVIYWTKNLEHSVKVVGEKSVGYKIMHVKSAQRSEKIYNFLMYIGIFMGPLAGLISGIDFTLYPERFSILQTISSCIVLMSGIVVTIIKFGNFDEQTTAHRSSAAQYTSLENNVRRQLILPPNGRVDAVTYVTWVGDSFDELFKSSPLISRKVYESYIRDATKAGISIPDEYGLTINIDRSYNVEKMEHVIDVKDIAQTSKISETNEMKRSTTSLNTMTHLNKFDTPKMKYELRRLMGFSDHS